VSKNSVQTLIDQAIQSLSRVILGKEQAIRLLLACFLSRGHILIEDLPGMGKTTLSHALAAVMGLDYRRIQFTSDLLPADIVGVSVFNKNSHQFEFKAGPVFSEVILADEINRATPKTQGALLEAMEERQVTIDGISHPLPKLFFVLATQNPLTQMGTFPLPESQLDRFLMRISLGYPSKEAEREIILGRDRRYLIHEIKKVFDEETLLTLQLKMREVQLSEGIVKYIERLVQYTRNDKTLLYGISPRGTLALVNSAKAWAFIAGRQHVTPDDIQLVLGPVFDHRLKSSVERQVFTGGRYSEKLLAEVDVIG
jgi:MoxR-like ATPase